jgi:hypothetical protein
MVVKKMEGWKDGSRHLLILPIFHPPILPSFQSSNLPIFVHDLTPHRTLRYFSVAP